MFEIALDEKSLRLDVRNEVLRRSKNSSNKRETFVQSLLKWFGSQSPIAMAAIEKRFQWVGFEINCLMRG